MGRQWVLFGFSAAVCLIVAIPLFGQAISPPGQLAVNESAARATLLNNAIQLELPFAAPVSPGTHVVARISSPENTSSGQTDLALPAGSRSAQITLPWPRDGHGNPVDEIGWYRIGYEIRVNGAPAAHGILSIGAITPNLLALRLARPQAIVTGVPIRLRVFAGNPVTRKPFAGVRLKATLTFDSDSDKKRSASRPIVHSAVTAANGEAGLLFPGPTNPGEDASLTLEGTLAGAHAGPQAAFARATLSADLETRDQTIFHTETDKPLHKPGETVHLRTLVLNDAGRAADNVPVTLTIKDVQDKTVLETSLTTNQFGIAAYDWKTTAQTATGSYTANFDEDDTSSYGQNADFPICIQRYDLPEFNVTAEMDRSFYLQGQTPAVKLHAGYLFGKPVAAGTVKVVRAGGEDWYSRNRKSHQAEETVAAGSLDVNGDASFQLDVKDDFTDLSGTEYERFRDLQFRAIVTDASTGRSEPRNFTVRISRYPVHIYLSEPEGDARRGDVIISTTYADGSPAACSIQLDWMDENSNAAHAATAETNRYGLAKVHLRYPPSAATDDQPDFSLRVTARDLEGRMSVFDDTLRTLSARIWVSVARSLLRPGEPIQGTLHGDPGSVVDIDVLSDATILDHLQVRMRHASELFTIPSDSRFRGGVSIRVYRFAEEEPGYDSWSGKSVLYPENRELRLKATGIKPSYPPGAHVDANLRLTSAAPGSLSGAIGVTVFDSAVAQRAETEEDANNRWFGGAWWMEGRTAGGLTLADLNKVDTSRPVPDDLELAAEVILADAPQNEIQIEGSSDLDIRNQYSQHLESELKPLGAAIENVSTPRLPRTVEAVQQVARDAHLDPALLDPWNTPYKVEASNTAWNESITLVSAGPDKKFGTDDDLSISLAQRNLFAVPGAKLNSLLTAVAGAGRPLPADTDQLKALALAGGLDLDSAAAGTRSPDGHAYNYKIVVQRSFYHVVAEDEKNNFDVWTSTTIDYFSSMEARIDAALRAWTDANKSFPSSEDEAHQALAAAGIDFDALRDPLGQRFQLRVTDTFAYTMQQRVKAGSSLQVSTKPVTEKVREIEILRGESSQVVAQFLHPLNQQSGSDLTPQPTSQGAFKGNSGAVGGTVTDQTGAVIQGAIVTVRGTGGAETSATADQNGAYLIRDLAPGLYRLTASARGFQSFEVYEVRISAASLTTVDIELRVGATTETVTVSADAVSSLQTTASVMAVSRGVVGPDRKTIVAGPAGRAVISETVFTPRLRHVFDETAYWAPSLLTSGAGRANLSFQLPDSLTTWTLHALASTADGRIGVLDHTFYTFQPFFIDLDAPQVLTASDQITLPVNLRNYTAQPLSLRVTVKPSDWFQLATPPVPRVSVPAGATVPVSLALRATAAADEGPLQLTAANSHDGDAVEKKVRVHPDGQPRSVNASSLLRGASTTLTLDLPADTIPGSLHAELRLYPNLGAQLVHSIKASLERPYGCGEQTISSTYPSLLFLPEARASHVRSPAQGAGISAARLRPPAGLLRPQRWPHVLGRQRPQSRSRAHRLRHRVSSRRSPVPHGRFRSHFRRCSLAPFRAAE